MFLKRVDQRERGFTLMVSPVNWFVTHVLKKVVHPTHIPFETESQPAQVSRT